MEDREGLRGAIPPGRVTEPGVHDVRLKFSFRGRGWSYRIVVRDRAFVHTIVEMLELQTYIDTTEDPFVIDSHRWRRCSQTNASCAFFWPTRKIGTSGRHVRGKRESELGKTVKQFSF
jgi:hypothetical protein